MHVCWCLSCVLAERSCLPRVLFLADKATSPEPDIRQYAAFVLANLSSNGDWHEMLGKDGAIVPICVLGMRDDSNVKCLGAWVVPPPPFSPPPLHPPLTLSPSQPQPPVLICCFAGWLAFPPAVCECASCIL